MTVRQASRLAMYAAGCLALAVAGGVQAQAPGDAVATAAPAVAAVQRVVAAIAALIAEYEPTNDQRILRCLKHHHGQAKMLEAVVLGLVAGAQANAEVQTLVAREAMLADSFGQAAQIEADARACLRVQSGEIINYAANAAEGPPDNLPELEAPPSPIVTEPEPVDRPLSDAETP